MSRARVQTAALMLSVILLAGGMLMPLALARARNRPSPASTGNLLLRQFPLGKRRLCCTTRAGSGVGSSTSFSSSSASGRNAGTGSAGAGGTGGGSWLLVVIAVLVVVLGALVVRPSISRRRQRARGRSAADRDRAAPDLRVRRPGPRADRVGAPVARATREPLGSPLARPASEPLRVPVAPPVREPIRARDVVSGTVTNGEMPGREAAAAKPAGDRDQPEEVVVRKWTSNPVGARDIARAKSVRGQVDFGEAGEATRRSIEAGGNGAAAGGNGAEAGGNGAARADGGTGEELDPGPAPNEREESEPALPYPHAEEHGASQGAFNLGLLSYEAGELARAEVIWRRCLAHGHARAAANLGFLLEQRGDERGALLAYSAAHRWGDPEGQRLRAALLGNRESSSQLTPGPPGKGG